MRAWLAAALTLLSIGTAHSQPDWHEVRLQARPTLGDLSRYSRPLPVTVEVQYTGQNTQSAKAVVYPDVPSMKVTGEAETTLAPGPSRQLSVMHPFGSYGVHVKVESGRQQTAPQTLNISAITDNDTLALILAPTGTEFAYLSGYKSLMGEGEFRINRPRTGTILPELWPAYLSADMIVLHDVPRLNLTPGVQKAIVDWTRAGGTLVLVSNGAPDEWTQSAFADVLPLAPEGSVSKGKYSRLTGKVSGQPLQDDLAYFRELDAGLVFQIGVNVKDQETLGNKPTEKLWSELAKRHKNRAFRQQRFQSSYRLLAHPAELPVPSAATIAWYLVAYVFLAVPINYLALRRRDRMLYMIFTAPAVALLFSAGAYVVNSSGRSSEVVLRELGVTLLWPGSITAVSDHSLVLFSPSSLKFQLKVPHRTYFRPQDVDSGGYYNKDLHLVLGADSMTYRDFRLSMWSIARFRSTHLSTLNGPLQLRVLNSQGSHVKLHIDNRTGLEIKDCVWTDPTHQHSSKPFPLGSGVQTVDCELEVPTDNWSGVDPDDAMSLRQQLDQVLAGRPYLAGVSTDPKLGAGLDLSRGGARHQYSLLVVPGGKP